MDLDNITAIENLTEDSLLKLLNDRFLDDSIFTAAGDVMLTTNPCKMMDDLFDPSKEIVSSHLYNIPQRSLENLKDGFKNQTILINGESGAGKTEAAKYIMKYLAEMSENTKSDEEDSYSQIEKAIVTANPVLEAFGNAKTLKNDNSSRFGKFVKIQYSPRFDIIGAETRHFLLEVSRLVKQPEGERNFHILYYLCAGIDDERRAELMLGSSHYYDYIRGAEEDDDDAEHDEAMFNYIEQCVDVLGVETSEWHSVLRILGAILHIGNVTFGKNPADDRAILEKNDDFSACCILLGIPEDRMEFAFTNRTISAGASGVRRRASVKVLPLSHEQAIHSRDALAKALYAAAFNFIVGKINECCGTTTEPVGKEHPFIGILDIYGFEVFEENGFEQMCINYANEKLQSLFNEQVFRQEFLDCEREGIDVTQVTFEDNQPVLDLFEGKPRGVFNLLDEQGMLGSGANDTALLHKLEASHLGKSKSFSKPQFGQTSFVVKHFAGPVEYVVEDFVFKNNDALAPDLQKMIMLESSDEVSRMFNNGKSMSEETGDDDDDDEGESHEPEIFNQIMGKVTVCSQFKSQISRLMSTLADTKVQFVRCLRPNDTLEAGEFDSHSILAQLRSLGVLETVRIRRDGFPVRMTYKTFRQRFCALFPAEETNLRAGCEATVNNHSDEELNNVENVQYGKTKVFFKDRIHHELQLKARAIQNEKSIQLQAICKGFVARKNFQKQKAGVRSITHCAIAFLLRSRYLRQKRACLKLQSFSRMAVKRAWFLRTIKKIKNDAATKIQTQTRQKLAIIKVNFMRKQRDAATIIQKHTRRYLCEKYLKVLRRSTVIVQSLIRRRLARNMLGCALESRKMWTFVLDPNEGLALSALVRKKNKMGINAFRRRQLLLTTKPRLLYIDPVENLVKRDLTFDEILDCKQIDEHEFHLTTKERVFKFVDLMGNASRWAEAIAKPRCLDDVLHGRYWPGTTIRQGMLTKQAVKSRRNWRRRFFVLLEDEIKWFKSEKDTVAKGSVQLEAPWYLKRVDVKPYALDIITPFIPTGFRVACENEAEMFQWVKALKRTNPPPEVDASFQQV